MTGQMGFWSITEQLAEILAQSDPLSWMRFCQLGPKNRVPDANTLWNFRKALILAGALDDLIERLDQAINAVGYLPPGGQIVDTSLEAQEGLRHLGLSEPPGLSTARLLGVAASSPGFVTRVIPAPR